MEIGHQVFPTSGIVLLLFPVSCYKQKQQRCGRYRVTTNLCFHVTARNVTKHLNRQEQAVMEVELHNLLFTGLFPPAERN